MELLRIFLPLLFLVTIIPAGVQNASAQLDDKEGRQLSSHHHHHKHHLHGHQADSFVATKLFVFGDSYADTGNIPKNLANSWKQPYGITFPGKPAGRFSDGRILTDFVAKYYRLKSPIPYRLMKYAGYKLRYGVNFAYGGTGVFDTTVLLPNMTTQIDFFAGLLNQSVFTKNDLQSSLFLVALSGNDYGAYMAKGGSDQGLPAFIKLVVTQLGTNLKRLYDLGARKIVVTALPPLGCLPRTTFLSSFQECNATQNQAVAFHNLLLSQAVANLNNLTNTSSFIVLDLFSFFTTVLNNKSDFPDAGSLRFETPLKPCCNGVGVGNFCASLSDKGDKLYTLCNDRDSAFFWDSVHPTQAGWQAVSGFFHSTLQLIH